MHSLGHRDPRPTSSPSPSPLSPLSRPFTVSTFGREGRGEGQGEGGREGEGARGGERERGRETKHAPASPKLLEVLRPICLRASYAVSGTGSAYAAS
eukprot:1278262-Rhodomonas_salina.1